MSKKECEKLCKLLSDYLDGELGENECFLIDEHLLVCEPCKKIYESLRLSLRACSQGLPPDIPGDVRIRLKDFLKEHCMNK